MLAPRLAAILVLLATVGSASAQSGTQVPFGTKHDASQPVEVTSDALQLDQAAGTALFSGTVRVAQGELRLAADRVEVFYAAKPAAGAAAPEASGSAPAAGAGGASIERLEATGNVILSNGPQAAKAEAATYRVATGIVEMTGNVLLTQGPNAVSGQSMRIDLNAGTGLIEGRVQTIFTPGSAPGGAAPKAAPGASR